MAIAPTLFDNNAGSVLSALLRDGVAAINGAVNNNINIGKDRATVQLNQENTLFRVMDNEKNLELRKAEDLRRNYETDRLFKRTTVRDARTDEVTDRNFARGAFVQDRAFSQAVSNADRNYDLSLKNSTSADQARKDTLAINASRNERDAIKDNFDILNLQRSTEIKDELLNTQKALRDQSLGSTTTDVLSNPGGSRTLPTPDLTEYVDLFGGSTNPVVQGHVNAARRELATREPGIDPSTGKVIPSKFAGDKTDPFEGLTDPQDQLFVAQDIAKEITDIQKDLAVPNTSSKTKAVLLKRVDELKNKLRKAPVSIQKLSGSATDNMEKTLDDLFTRKK